MKNLIARFAKDESGATAIEYGLIAAGISLAIIAAVNGLGTKLSSTFGSINTSLIALLPVAGLLFVLGGVAGFLAARFLKASTPPVPEMAIDEAGKIKRTLRAFRRRR